MQARHINNNKLSIFNKEKNVAIKTSATRNPKSLVTPSGPMMKSQSKI